MQVEQSDDLRLNGPTPWQSVDIHQLAFNRHRDSSVITFNSALDRLANARFRIVIEGNRKA